MSAGIDGPKSVFNNKPTSEVVGVVGWPDVPLLP